MLCFGVSRKGVSDSKMTPEKRQNDEIFIFGVQSFFLRWGNRSWQQDVEQW